MAYGDFEDLKRRTFSDKVLRDKASDIAKNHKYDGYQRGLASMVYKFFDKKLKGRGVNIPLEFHEQLATQLLENLTNQFIENFKKEKFILDLKIIFGVLI